MRTVVMIAKRTSPISILVCGLALARRVLRVGEDSFEVARDRGLHFIQASMEARQG